MALTPGTHLGPYEILALAGVGGMGEVYKARDTRLDRIVAVKVLPAGLSQDPDRRQRFVRESRAIAALSHPNICTLHDVGHQDGIDFLVMEYLEGETLAAPARQAAGVFHRISSQRASRARLVVCGGARRRCASAGRNVPPRDACRMVAGCPVDLRQRAG